MISLIAAIAKNRVIGNKNAVPWNLPSDFRWFKEKTFGKQLIVGRKTFESIGKNPLPDRTHIIMTTRRDYEIPRNCSLAHSMCHVQELMRPDQEVMVCGGGIVYQQFLPIADRMYLTYINHAFEGDVFFPEFPMAEWTQVERKNFQSDEENAYAYTIVTLEKRKS